MCEPATIALIGSTVLGAAGQIQAGRSQARADKFNAVQQEREADRGEEASRLEEFRNRQKIAGVKGAQAAGQAANGVLIDGGSPLDVLADTAAEGAFEAFMLRDNAARQRRNLLEGASLDRASAKNARNGALLSAGGTLLSGAGKVAQKWYDKAPDTTTDTSPFAQGAFRTAPNPRRQVV